MSNTDAIVILSTYFGDTPDTDDIVERENGRAKNRHARNPGAGKRMEA